MRAKAAKRPGSCSPLPRERARRSSRPISLWRLSQAGQLPKPALFLCDRDELREQAYTKLKAAFGDNARIVKTEQGKNAAQNARIHIATYQTLGLDDDEGFASFLTENYGEDAFSVIIIDECHRSAWGKWSEVLKRNPNAIHIGLTATPRKLYERQEASNREDQKITANNHQYFGEPVYEYTLIQAQEDGYLAACEIVKRKASIDSAIFTKEEILAAGAKDIRTGLASNRSGPDERRSTPARTSTMNCSSNSALPTCVPTSSSCCARMAGRNRRSSSSALGRSMPTV